MVANTFLATNPDHISPIFRDSIVLFLLTFCALSGQKNGQAGSFEIRFSTNTIIMIFGIFLVIASVLTRAAISVATHTSQYAECSMAGGFLYQAECVLFASAIGNASLRIAIPHLFALAIAVVSAIIVKNNGNRTNCLLFVATASLTVFLLEEFLGRTVSLRPFYTSIFGTLGPAKYGIMSGPFTNYGWSWPYIAPVSAISFWLLAGEHSRKIKLAGAVFTLICGWITFTNGQRGAILAFTGCSLITSFWVLWANVFRKKIATSKITIYVSTAIIMLVVIGAGILVFSDNLTSLNAITSVVGFTFKKMPMSSSASRLQLWQFGFEMWKLNPLHGNGHGSWIWLSFEHAPLLRKTLMFESAHNLYVQLLTELGLIHSILILGVFAFVTGRAFLVLRNEKSGSLLFLLLLASFGVATLVQEIDYIKTTYYQWAAILGIVVVDVKPLFSVLFKLTYRKIVLSLALFLTAIFTFNSVFSRGVYAFEPRQKNQPWPTWERWLKPDATLTAPPGLFKDQGYTIFPVSVTHGDAATGTNDTYQEDDIALISGLIKADRLFVSIPGRSFGIKTKSIHLSHKQNIDSRTVSARLGYPAFQSRAKLIWGRNVAVEMNDGALELVCQTPSCYLLIGQCRTPSEKPRFSTSGGVPDVSLSIVELPLDVTKSKLDGFSSQKTIRPSISAEKPTHWAFDQNSAENKAQFVTVSTTDNKPIRISEIGCE